MQYRTFILDQGETLGGAERFMLDFLSTLSESETRKLGLLVVGAKAESYQKMLPEHVSVCKFAYPSLKGGVLLKLVKIFSLFRGAWRLKMLVRQVGSSRRSRQFFANTPRTIFVTYLAKKFFRLRGRLIIMIHDFTIPAWLLRKLAKSADIIVVNSIITRQTIREQITESDHEKIRIIENGIDFAQIPLAQVPQKFERVVILGRIDPRKGQIYAIEAADLLHERNPDLQFFVVGRHFEGDPATFAYDQQLKSLVEKRELANVHFIDEVEDPFSVFASADMVLVLPVEPETFGRVVIEALAMGKLVLAFDEVGPRQILESFAKFCDKSSDFILVEKGNAMSLAELIGYHADNPDSTEDFTMRAREFVEKHYPLSETKKRLLGLLLEG